MYTSGGRRILTTLILCGGCLLSSWGWAADQALELPLGATAPVSLTEYFSVLEDPERALTLADVQKADVSGRFVSGFPAGDALNFGYSRSAYWLRLTLKNSSDQALQRMLEVHYPGITSIQLHQPTAGGPSVSVETGSVMPFATRPYANRFFVFPLNVAAHTQQTMYLRIRSYGPITLPARLWEPQAFHAYERSDYMAQAWYFGIAAAMILFNLLLFVALWDVAYLLYVAFATSMALTMAAQNGLAKEFLWNDSPLWSNIASSVGYSYSLAALLVFMRYILHTRQVIPYSDRVLKPLVGLFLAAPIGFGLALPVLVKPAALLYGATGALVLVMGVWCAIKRQRSAYFFLAAFAVLCLAAMVSVLRALGWLPTNPFTVNALQFGSGLEMMLLAFALADRFNAIRREKALAQREALVAQQRLVESLQASERVLEERVQQRTAELDSKNVALTQAMSSLETVERIARHDLKTPLGSLVAAPALLRAGRVMNAQEERVLGMMESAANRALHMVNLSLDLYRMENGNYVVQPECVDLTALVKSVFQDLDAHARSKSVLMEVTDQWGHVFASAEESLCYSIVANLVKNAVEAAPEHSVVRVALHGGPMASMRIHNQGAVPASMRERFFTKYASDGKQGGTGLGAYSSQLLARVQGGRLSMETSDALGTTLTLELNSWPGGADADLPASVVANGATPVEHGPQALGPQRVLVVDDDDFNRMVMLAQLQYAALEVESAINGCEALERVMHRRPHLIFLDIEMPIMGGLEALQRIRDFQAQAAQKPSFIVAYSGSDDAQSHARYLAHGFDHCLNKPGTQHAFLALLHASQARME
ncbi:MAG: 7TM diverse intracellular signaling domain-containing protein [Rhodoferax sp.]|nr:7TM diverse intracellular signaling domain-containing protein [Rhodoferax sp.]MDP3652375.1 7TM diverse intracellular signaling domain-containing protein [Rhodoferax sp.]